MPVEIAAAKERQFVQFAVDQFQREPGFRKRQIGAGGDVLPLFVSEKQVPTVL